MANTDRDTNENEIYPTEEAREDLAKLIASETSGLRHAIPEREDYELADSFIKQINERFDAVTEPRPV